MSAKVIPDKIHLIGFRILHAEMKSPLEFDMNQIKSFNNSTALELVFNLEDSLVKSEMKVEIDTVSNSHSNEKEASAQFNIAFIFHVENFKELATVLDDENLDIKGGLDTAIASIVYSTTRGVLMTRFQGTALADFILPIIDPAKLTAK